MTDILDKQTTNRIIDSEMEAMGLRPRAIDPSWVGYGSGVWIDLPKWVSAATKREGEQGGRRVVRLYFKYGWREAESYARGSLLARARYWFKAA